MDDVQIRQDGQVLQIPFRACVLYHGHDSIGGLVLGYRLIQWAIRELSPLRVPDREEITFKTAFPGPGVRDAVEMLTRAVSRGAYKVITDVPEDAPEGVYGHMYFEITVGTKTKRVSLVPDALSSDFILTGRAYKRQCHTPELIKHWTELKQGLADSLMQLEDLGVILKQYE